jgi:hypothetical protein
VPPRLERLNVIEPEGVLRIDREGNVNFETGGEVSQAPPTLLNDLRVQVDGGRLRIINQFEGQNTDVLVSDLHADLDVTTDLAVKGRGGALVGLVVPGSRGSRPTSTSARSSRAWPSASSARRAAAPAPRST